MLKEYFLSKLLFVTILLFSGLIHVKSDLETQELLDSLPPDQRDSIMLKMQQNEKTQKEIDEVFEKQNSLIERPELTEEQIEDRIKCDECIFGYDFFKYSPSSFAPSDAISVTSDYILGPGDKLSIDFYGSIEQSAELFISREGILVLPLLGPVNLMGMKFGEATSYLQNKTKNELIGTQLSLSLKALRSISIYLLGEAYKPGMYTMSGLSSVSNALFISGGVNENGSLRNIKIIRNNETLQIYDFYNFLLKGALDNDVKLLDGDIIFIPFIENKIKMGGAFKRPHIYEFVEGETVKDAINLAGGFAFGVDPKTKIELSYIDQSNFTRQFKYLEKEENIKQKLRQGDVLNIYSKSGISSETITLSGEVRFPGEYSIQQGDTILDIINRAGGYSVNGYSEGAVFLREEVAKSQKKAFLRSADELENTLVDIISQNSIDNITEFTLTPITKLITKLREEEPLGRMIVNLNFLGLKTSPELNFQVQGGDSLHIPKRPNSVSVVGEVLNTSTQVYNPKFGVEKYISLSGGLSDSADKNRIFIILPDGRAELIQKSLFSSKNILLPGSTIVVSRDSRPFDAIKLTQIITPILADLATSAAAIAAISD